MRNGKGKTWKTIGHASFSVLQRWQIYTNIAPFVEAVNRYQLISEKLIVGAAGGIATIVWKPLNLVYNH